MNCCEHIEFIVKKSSKYLGFIKRYSSEFKDPKSFKALYSALVRSILEFSSIIWSPYTNLDCESIERVQNRFLRYVAFKINFPLEPHNYGPIRINLDLPTLCSRREAADVAFIYNLINGLINSPCLLNLIMFNVPNHHFRSPSLFYIPPHNTNFNKNSPLSRSMSLCNKYPNFDFFSDSLFKIIKCFLKF